jgi:hypothetical protein
VEKDGEGSGVGGEDDDLGDAAVESLGGLVGSLLQLLVVRGLLDDIEDLLAESCVGDGPGCANVRRVLEGGLTGGGTYQQIRSVLLPFLNLVWRNDSWGLAVAGRVPCVGSPCCCQSPWMSCVL